MSLRSQVELQVTNNTTGFSEVAGSADLTKVLTGNITDNGCYIFSEGETAGPPELVHNVMCQEVTEQISLITTVKNVVGLRQITADDECAALRLELHNALLGFEPVDYEPLTYVGGRLLSFTKGFYIYKSTYTTKTSINSI